MMSGKRLYPAYTVLAAVLCVLAAVGSFFDRDIDSALYTPGNVPMLLLTIAGQYFFFAVCVFFTGMLCRQAVLCRTVTRGRKTAYILICGYLALSTGMICSFSVLHYECIGAFFPDTDFSVLFTALFCAILVEPLFIAGYAAAGKKYDAAAVKTLIRLLIFITVTAVFMTLLKHIFPRPRFRLTLMGYEGIEFTPWYSPLWDAPALIAAYGIDYNEMRSFPSAHAVMSMSAVYILPALSGVFPRLKGKEGLLFAAGLIYGLSVMFSRLVLGAHFLSDVSFGAIIAVGFGFFFWRSREKISDVS